MIHNHFQTISVAIAIMTAINAYPIELMYSVASRICVTCLIQVMSHLMDTLYKCKTVFQSCLKNTCGNMKQ